MHQGGRLALVQRLAVPGAGERPPDGAVRRCGLLRCAGGGRIAHSGTLIAEFPGSPPTSLVAVITNPVTANPLRRLVASDRAVVTRRQARPVARRAGAPEHPQPGPTGPGPRGGRPPFQHARPPPPPPPPRPPHPPRHGPPAPPDP